MSAANVAEVVEREREAWLLVFEGEGGASPIAGGGAEALAEAVFGQVKVAKAAADLAAKFGAGPAPSLIASPCGTGQKSAKKAQKFGGDEAGVAAAKKAALESLPTDLVEVISAQNADRWLGQGVAGDVAQRRVHSLLRQAVGAAALPVDLDGPLTASSPSAWPPRRTAR